MASQLTVKILGDAKSLTGALDTAAGKLASFGKAAAKSMAVVGVAAAAGAIKLGVDLDKAIDNIIVGTGASGEALEGLKSDFETVASSVPASFGDVSTAIADINTRLGLTGEPLQSLSTQFLELSRLTGTDVATNISNMSRVFGDAGIAVEDQGAALDKLFKTSQNTGIGLDQLSTTVVNFGAPMRQLGFNFEESISLLGKFDKEGVNTEAVMAGLKAGLGKMAKAGEEPIETLDRVMEAIKGAGSQGEANAIALEAFGQRAGPDMAAAIREGRFEIDDMVAGLADADGSIMETAEATRSWTEKLRVLANKVMIKLAPIAEAAFDTIGQAIEAVSPHLETLIDWIAKRIPPTLTALKDAFDNVREAISATFTWLSDNRHVVAGIAAAIGTILVAAVAAWTTATWAQVSALTAQAAAFVAANAPLIAATAAIAAVAAAVVYAYENFEWFRTAVDAVRDWMVNTLWPAIQAVADGIADGFEALAGFVRTHWDTIKAVIDGVVTAITTIIQTNVAIIQTLWDTFGEHILNAVETVWETIKSTIDAAIQFVQGVIETVMAVITGDWSAAWEGIKGVVSGIWEGIKGLVSGAIDLISTKIAVVTAAIAFAWSTVWEGIKTVVSGIWDRIKEFVGDGIDAVVEFVKGIPGRLVEWATNLLDAGKELGGAIIDGVIGGLGDVASLLLSPFKKAWNGIAGWWNDGPGTWSFKIPGWVPGVGGKGWEMPDIPTFHSGGWVGNPLGPPRDIPAILQQGEYVVSREDARAARGPEWSGPVTLIVEGSPFRAMIAQDRAEIEAALLAGVR